MFFKKKNKNGEERKERSDKKVHVGPTISSRLIYEVERFAYITDQPIGRIGVLLCYEGVRHREVIERFAPYFQRGILRVENTLFYGYPDNPTINEPIESEAADRISIRFTQRDYEDISLLANLLDISPTRATAILIDAAIRHPEIIEYILQHHNNRMAAFDDVTTAELKKFMRYVNRDNPYKATWNETLVFLVEGAKQKFRGITRKITPKAVDRETYRWNFDDSD
ncbi:hypothetical protein MHZ92_14230 [Sporosarcina sp. ACRSL]|uniref:hypothetical protein n=1 Tax=Sporosarcina sp. ACRSL TaxID=2918215 RepID=UPI001EF52F28|nr:hypothetical protein [Sporosarcina sp. ACRSL]MCG7345293.1 hypothetical protein [Sporosarcina sp. ACRSL]